MKKQILSILLVAALLSITTFCDVFAAEIDNLSPYSGDYLLAINTSTNVTNTQYSGLLSMNSSEIANTLMYTDTTDDMSAKSNIVDIKEENGLKMEQIDPRSILAHRERNTIAESTQTSILKYSNIYAVQYVVGAQRTLATADFRYNPPRTVNKTFTLKYSGSKCNIWLENGGSVNLNDSSIESIGSEFDNNIYTNMTNNFGSGYDKDGDGKTAIMLYDIQDGWDGINVTSYLGGFFDSGEIQGNDNNMDVIHIDTYPLMGTDKNNPYIVDSKSVIVHEYQHFLNFSYSFLNGLADMPIWLNEGLSMAAEHMLYGALYRRIDYFNQSTYIRDGYSLLNWNQNGDILSNYALSYLFVQYIRTQTKSFEGGGNAVFKSFIQNSNRTSTVVQDVMRLFFSSVTLSDVQINFRIATLLNEPTGVYGFMNEANLDYILPLLYQGSGTNLSGGGAVIKAISSPITPKSYGSNIKFVGFKANKMPTPNVSVASGIVEYGTQAILSCPISNATIRYTTDGSTPTLSNGSNYYYPIGLTSNKTIKAITCRNRMYDSDVATFSYSVKASNPTSYPVSGTVASGTKVSLNSSYGTSIRYTTDGTLPTTTSGILYSAQITITANTTIKAIAYRDDLIASDISNISFYVKTAIPVANITSGTYLVGTQVALSCSSVGANIRYTTDGTTPTAETGIIYNTPINLTSNTTIKAISYKSLMEYSDVTTYTYNVSPKVSVPIANYPSGIVEDGTQIVLSTTTNDASIRYTTFGSEPTSGSGTLYSAPIIINYNTTIKAIAYKSGEVDSDVVTYTYNIKASHPKANIAEGFVYNNSQIKLSSTTSGCSFRYTTDGSTPTSTEGILYSNPIIISSNTIIKAIAYKDGIADSDTAIFSYKTLPAVSIYKNNFGGSSNDYYNSVITVEDGYVAVGYSYLYSTNNGDWVGVTGKGTYDAIIVKYGTNGNVIWKKNFGGTNEECYTSVTAVNDGFITVGYANYSSFGYCDWTYISGKGAKDAIVVKYDLNGNVVWKKNFGGSSDDSFNSVSTFNDGFITVGYSFINGTGDWIDVTGKGQNDAIIVKYDLNGNVVWKKNFGDSNNDQYNSVATADDGYIAIGYSYINGTGDWTDITGKGQNDAIIVKYDLNGNVLWKKNFGGSNDDKYNSVAANADGYIAVGYSNINGTGDWTGVVGKGSDDAIIVKYDTTGNVIWQKNFGGSSSDSYNSVRVSNSEFITVGYSASSSFNNGDWAGVTGKGSTDAIIVKYDKSGNVILKNNFGGSSDDKYTSVIFANAGSYVAVGYANIGYISGDWTGLTSKGYNDAIIVKYKEHNSTLSDPFFNNSYGIYSSTALLNLLPKSAGTYTLKAQYTNTTGESKNMSFVVILKYNNKIKDVFVIPKAVEIDEVVDISKDIALPSATTESNLEIKILAVNGMSEIKPLTIPISIIRSN